MPELISPKTILARLRNAVSTPAGELDDKIGAIIASAQRSRSLFGLKSDAIAAIWSVAAEAAEDDWNGEGALAIDPMTAGNAVAFLDTLPPFARLPEISAEPSGALSLDWIHSRTKMFSVSVGRSRSLALAWLDGTAHGYGVVSFDGEDVPPRILDEVLKLQPDGAPLLRLT